MTNTLGPDVLDFEAVIKICGGKKEFAHEILQMLVDELPEQRAQIKAAFEEQNWPQFEYLTHKLCGSAAYCGMSQLRQQCACLNRDVKEQDPQERHKLFQDLLAAIESALQASANMNVVPST